MTETMVEKKVQSPAVFIKRGGEQVTFERFKLQLILERMGLKEQETKIIETVIEQLKEKKAVSAHEVHREMIVALNQLGFAKEAIKFLQVYQKNEKNWIEETDPQKRLERLQVKDPSLVHENANKDSNVFNTQRDLTAGAVGKTLGLKMMPEYIAKAHLRGDIHYHDLDYTPWSPMTNCCLIDFKEMLNNGFKIGNAEVESPHSIQTATAQMAQIIANVASSQYGGCSADRVDELLAPFALRNYHKHLEAAAEYIPDEAKRKEFAQKRTKKDIYDAMQGLEYEINTLFSSQGQTPFTTLGFGLGTSWVEREVQRAILEVRIKGLGREKRTAIFPKLVFTLKKGLNLKPGDPNYALKKLAVECATKRMYPDVLMYDKIKELTGSFKVPMGCRSFLQGWKDKNGQEVNSGRMNLGVVTVNLPRIALESNGNQQLFWKIFKEKMALCKNALVFKVGRVKEALPENAPILYQYGAFGKRLQPGESVDQLFKERRATVSLGYIGLYEVGTIFYGPEWEQNKEAHDFTLEIVKKMKNSCVAWSDEYDYHFSLYSTPSESLTDRFCVLDTKRFGKIKDITAKEYYTNSFHYDVRKHPSPFEKLKFEMDYPKYASGGFIHYCEYPNLKQNPKALEAVWDWAYDKVGYLGTNTPIDHCFKCDFKGEFKATARGFECPECGNHDPKTCDCVKRTCGYLGNPLQRPMVHGRHVEIASRKKNLFNGAINNEE
ncbi:anaerobic ribonucleoside-triphosphate reductase [Liquorilactobacillus satsumensis]|nr:anaerobic ribonucleoside-triphosphate reductase [Liquorilactobacillus satsumensis]MCP9356478.1 anaerobic ribonucleoside-triphosphate reductase [Liquorilactobacillus satsumensis]MCP9370383.1 anaerobic ribonucleoside-triphosphate reductase [Liquorilactobacillus satsumensis]